VWDEFVVGLFFDFKDDWVKIGVLEVGVFAVGEALSDLGFGIDNGWRGLLFEVMIGWKRSRTGLWIKVEQGMVGKAFMWGDSAGRWVVAFEDVAVFVLLKALDDFVAGHFVQSHEPFVGFAVAGGLHNWRLLMWWGLKFSGGRFGLFGGVSVVGLVELPLVYKFYFWGFMGLNPLR
jgi:hypothetical protein